ncbi:uncharacterized protein K441DRAFT_692400 [Cenococcum geophilum 1.58]|uniref:uncharacterized protein n=1 Tax=Cenococcum geophilum 1.58 TaxID=794803 RepID=UPI00358F2888|nr:hypothetical protein K441DRAFT_692400 [Cenococcum geophilum 1.58]
MRGWTLDRRIILGAEHSTRLCRTTSSLWQIRYSREEWMSMLKATKDTPRLLRHGKASAGAQGGHRAPDERVGWKKSRASFSKPGPIPMPPPNPAATPHCTFARNSGPAKHSCPSTGPFCRHKRPGYRGHHHINGGGSAGPPGVRQASSRARRGFEIQDETSDRRTYLHQAASAGSAQCIRMLAQSGANVNCGDKNDSTPLTLPSEEGHLDVV